MAEFRINVRASIPPWAPVDATTFPSLAAAVKRITESVHARWVAYARGEPMPNGKSIQTRTGQYARSIGMRETGPLTAEVFTDLAYASAIEDGAPSRDLKRMLHSSHRTRVNKRGRLYLIIPFRWNAPGSVLGNTMPEAVHEWWHARRARSQMLATTERLSGAGREFRAGVMGAGASDRKTKGALMTPAWKYKWGERLTIGELGRMGIGGEQAKRMQGMVNFRKPGGTGNGAHSKFITFRVMTQDSKGWIAKPTEGKHPAQQVAAEYQPIAEELFGAAVAADVQRLIERG